MLSKLYSKSVDEKDWADSLYNVELHREPCSSLSVCVCVLLRGVLREHVNTGTVLSSGGGQRAYTVV